MQQSLDNLPVPSTYARILLQGQPAEEQRLLADTGLDAEDLAGHEVITVAQQLSIFRNAMGLTADPEWGLKFGQRLNFSSHGSLGFAALSAPTIGDGLDVFAKFTRSRAPYLNLRAERGDGYFRMHFEQTIPLRDLHYPLAEVLLLILESYVLAVLGHVPAESLLSFAFPRPDHVERYAEYFKLPQQFDARFTCIQFPLSLCAMPCPLHEHQTYQTSMARCREALVSVLDPSDAGSRVRHLLASHFDKIELQTGTARAPGLDSIATALFMSPRTLIRQLESHDLSYRQILEELQLETAQKLLAQSRYSVTDVAVLLGYSDAANFSRAFRRWTGQSPGRFRRMAP